MLQSSLKTVCSVERFMDCFLFSLVPTEAKFGWTGYADGLHVNEDFMRATPSAISMGSGTTVILTEVACACTCSTRPPFIMQRCSQHFVAFAACFDCARFCICLLPPAADSRLLLEGFQ